jgi:hypothetical protein
MQMNDDTSSEIEIKDISLFNQVEMNKEI